MQHTMMTTKTMANTILLYKNRRWQTMSMQLHHTIRSTQLLVTQQTHRTDNACYYSIQVLEHYMQARCVIILPPPPRRVTVDAAPVKLTGGAGLGPPRPGSTLICPQPYQCKNNRARWKFVTRVGGPLLRPPPGTHRTLHRATTSTSPGQNQEL